MTRSAAFWLLTLLTCASLPSPGATRARDLGIPFDGEPGHFNAITDVPGVEVGHATIVEGKGIKGELHTARTGVTVVFPIGKKSVSGVPAAWGSLNGNGEITGVTWLQESGLLEGAVAMTNTASVGLVRDSLIDWVRQTFPDNDEEGLLPIVAETDDSWVNDLYGFHVKKEHVFEAIANARGGAVAEGCVGAGTGTVTFRFKAGIGTSSRNIEGGYHLGVLVQSNFGLREDFKFLGVGIGKALANEYKQIENPLPRRDGSIVIVVATDAPLLPSQLQRIIKRIPLGIALVGGVGRNSSGDLFVAFSTVRPQKGPKHTQVWTALTNEQMDPFFVGAVQATEEAIINALVAAHDTTGINGNKFFALPPSRLVEILKTSHRMK